MDSLTQRVTIRSNKFSGTFSPGQNSYGHQAIPAREGGYAIIGYTIVDNGNPAGDRNCYFVKVDKTGGFEWEKSFGTPENPLEIGTSLIQTIDGGYILLGETGVYNEEKGTWSSNIQIIKTDETGSFDWGKILEGEGNDRSAQEIIQTSNEEFIIIGDQGVFGGIILIKINIFGFPIWEETYKMDNTIYARAGSVIKMGNQGYILIGTTRKIESEDSDIYVVRADNSGRVLWEKIYDGEENEIGNSITLSTNGSFMIAGTSYDTIGNQDIYFGKIDNSGQLLWKKKFNNTGIQEGYSVKQDVNGNFILLGGRESSGREIYLMNIDSLGNQQWDKTFSGLKLGTKASFSITKDCGYIITGYKEEFQPLERCKWGFCPSLLVVKTDSQGNF